MHLLLLKNLIDDYAKVLYGTPEANAYRIAVHNELDALDDKLRNSEHTSDKLRRELQYAQVNTELVEAQLQTCRNRIEELVLTIEWLGRDEP